jgi:hypothetical protein
MEHLIMLVNNVKHVSTKGSFLEFFHIHGSLVGVESKHYLMFNYFGDTINTHVYINDKMY